MRVHLWQLSPGSTTSYDSICGLQEVSWVNIRGFNAEACKQCVGHVMYDKVLMGRNYTSRYYAASEQYKTWNGFYLTRLVIRRRDDPGFVGLWTHALPFAHGFKARRWARKIIGEERRAGRLQLNRGENIGRNNAPVPTPA